MAAVQIPKSCNHQNLIKALASANVLLEPFEKISFQVPEGCFVSTSALVFLASWGLWQKAMGTRFVCIGDDDTCKYISRMDLFSCFEIDFDEAFNRHTEIGRFIPIKLVDDVPSCRVAVDQICDLVLHQFDNARAFIPAMEWAVNEVIDNIYNHSQTPVPGTVCAQYFPMYNRLDIGIFDMGRGIKASLEESMELWSHGDAITNALQRGVTRNREYGAGNGLAGTHEICKFNNGEFHLWTGDADYCLKDGQEKGFQQIPEIPGTGALISLNTKRPVDLSETFIQESDWSFIDAEAQRLSEGESLKIIEECEHTGMREPAKRLYRKIIALLPDMEEPLNLDFEKVNSASSSFLDELLGKLVENIGEHKFQQQIRILNATDGLVAMMNMVIEQRIRT